MNGQQTLATVVERAVAMGASSCYLIMRQGIGLIVFTIGNQIFKVSTISPKVFADCNAVMLPYLQMPGAGHAHMQSGVMGFRARRGPMQVIVRSYQHVEPMLNLQFVPGEQPPISFTQLDLSGPASLAIRQFIATSQKLLFVASDNLMTSQLLFTQALYGVMGLFSRLPVLYCGVPLPLYAKDIHQVPEITQGAKQAPQWPHAVIIDNNFNPATAAVLSAPPTPKKLVITAATPTTLGQTLLSNIESLKLFADPRAYLPSIPLYIQAMPRLCYRCRQPVTLRQTDFDWLQNKLSGTVERNYTVPEPGESTERPSTIPQITHLGDVGGKSLLDMIARDPGMINRSADDKRKKQAEIKTKQVWQAAHQPACPICHGMGYDGYLVAAGFAELGVDDYNQLDKIAKDTERLTTRFWVDVFEKVDYGLIGVEHLVKLAVQADQAAMAVQANAEQAAVNTQAQAAAPPDTAGQNNTIQSEQSSLPPETTPTVL